MKAIDLTGQRFGRLLVLSFSHTDGIKRRWLCLCDCGHKTIVKTGSLRIGRTQSCGCLNAEIIKTHVKTHGGSYTPEFKSWCHLRDRCLNPNNKGFKNYGARGIKVCDRWLKFENFLADMGPRPSRKHSIDRINNNGDYEPYNCRWATAKQQSRNTRQNVFVGSKKFMDIVDASGEKRRPIYSRYYRRKLLHKL